jgi:CRP-like cAMP-binding protein
MILSRGVIGRLPMSNDRTPATSRPNRLLASLPEADRLRILPLLEPVELEFEQVLYEPRRPIEYAYFPAGTVIFSLIVMQDGNLIEVATIGDEGLLGYGAVSGGNSSPTKAVVQVAGRGLRIRAKILREQAKRGGPLRDLLGAYDEAFRAQVSQSVACNGLHRLEQRCCRWLLMSRDRVDSDELRLTHEFLGLMLGARRASVTDALRPLQEAGLVRSHRG